MIVIHRERIALGLGIDSAYLRLSGTVIVTIVSWKRRSMVDDRLTITELAEQLGVTTKTITRWEKAGKIRRAKRDWRGWRVYSPEDLEQMKSLLETVY